MLTNHFTQWIIFFVLIIILFAIDLGLFRRKSHTIAIKEAIIWSSIWITLSLIFAFGVYLLRGKQSGNEFLTAYFVEQSLSIDNLFIFVLIFNHFIVPPPYQHRVLFYGVLGAIILRGIFILSGIALIQQIHWVIYIFGAFLIFTGLKMFIISDKDPHLENNWLLRFMNKHAPITNIYHDDHFIVHINKQLWFTPLFLALIVIEMFDVIFAIDSVPAVLAISQDPFIVYTSNIFAILGLRSLYFVLATFINRLHYLKIGLAFIVIFIGCKMVLTHFYTIPTLLTLSVVLIIFVLTVIASLFKAYKT